MYLKLVRFFYVLAFLSVFMGFYKMLIYDNSKYGNNTNAYVGGDAFNYMINAEYAIAWFVLAVFFAIIGFSCMYAYNNSENNRSQNELIKNSARDIELNDIV